MYKLLSFLKIRQNGNKKFFFKPGLYLCNQIKNEMLKKEITFIYECSKVQHGIANDRREDN
tara:strand:+ start:543 stop:725 length:183 start_codon:yes stop_codon:yes gene_type:complete